MSDEDSDSFFCVSVERRPLSPAFEERKKVKSTRKTRSSTPDDELPRPLKRRKSPEIDARFSLDAIAAAARRRKGIISPPKGAEERQPLKALTDLPRVSKHATHESDVEDDLILSDLDESHTTEQVDKQKKQSALEILRMKRQGKLPLRDELEPPRVREETSKIRSGFRPASPTAQRKMPVPPVRPKAAPIETMESVAARVAASIMQDRIVKPSVPSKKPTEPSRPWALPTKEVVAPKRPMVTAQPKASTSKAPVQPKASSSKGVIDLDDSNEEQEGEEFDGEDGDDSIDAAFGMDRLSPRSRKKFLAIAGLLDDGDAASGKGDKLNGDWSDLLEQEKEPKKTAKRGKVWGGRRGKPWFRKKRGGGGRGRGRR